MARLTVEDCIVRVPNRFELVMVASHRARELASGVQPLLEKENDKNPVIALREIAEGVVDLEQLKSGLIHGMQRQVEVDEPEEDGTLTLPVIETEVSAEDEAVEEEAEVALPDGADDVEGV